MGQHKQFHNHLSKIDLMVTVQAAPHVNLDVDEVLKEDWEVRIGKCTQCQHWQSKLMSCVWLLFQVQNILSFLNWEMLLIDSGENKC